MSNKIKTAIKYLKEGNLLRQTINKIKRDHLFRNEDKYSDEEYLIKMGQLTCGYKMDLKDPKTFNEKINWFKLHYKNPLMVECVDKVTVDDYVRRKGCEDILIKKLAVWDNFEDINFDNLPNQFVLKANADSGGVLIVRDKTKFDFSEFEKLKESLGKDYSARFKEWPYKEVKHKIFAEEFLDDPVNKVPNDYKFYCFDGKVDYLIVCTERDIDTKIDFFDDKFNWLDMECTKQNNKKNRPSKPKNFEKMIEYAEILSKEFPQVRVDFYDIDGRVYFGELTFFDDAGFGYYKLEMDIWLGKKFDIGKIKKSKYYVE